MTESRLDKSKRNITAAILQYALNILLSWVGRIIFVRVLSADYLGINGLFTNLINILSIADLGIPAAMAYSLYKPLARCDTQKINSMISFFRKIYFFIAGAVLVIGLSLIPILPYIIKIDNPVPNLSSYYVLILINTVGSYVFMYRTTLLTADQKGYVLQRYIIIFRFISFVAKVIVLLAFRNYLVYLGCGVFVELCSNVAQNLGTLHHYPYLKEKVPELPESDRKAIWKNVFDLFIYRISGVIQTNTDSILISLYAGTVFVGYYSNYQMMILAVTAVISLIFSNVKASVGNMIASADSPSENRLKVYWTMESLNFWITAFSSISFICLFQPFIQLSFGSEYVLPFADVIVIVLIFYTSNIRQTIWVFRETTGLFHETRMVTTVTAVLNIILSAAIGWFYGMTGVLVATLISRIVYAWWKEPMILFGKVFGCSAKKYYINYLVQVLLFIIVCAASYFLCGFINVSNPYISFALKTVMCAVFPNAVFFALFFKNQGLRDLVRKLIPFKKQI